MIPGTVTDKIISGDLEVERVCMFDVLSIDGCTKCNDTFNKAALLLEKTEDEDHSLVILQKVNVTEEILADRTAFFELLRDKHGYTLYDPETPTKRYSFPIILQNGIWQNKKLWMF